MPPTRLPPGLWSPHPQFDDLGRDLASTSIVVTFNIGIAGGSSAGGEHTATYGPTAYMSASAAVVIVAAIGTTLGAVLSARRTSVAGAERMPKTAGTMDR